MEERHMESVTEPGSEEMGGIRRATGISSQEQELGDVDRGR